MRVGSTTRVIRHVYTADITQWERQMARMASQNAAVARRFEAFGGQMGRIGGTLTRTLTLPILAIGAASVKMAMNFDESMKKIETLVGVSAGQVQAWHQDVLKMAGEVGRSPKELADALYFVTSAGFRGKAALDVLRASAQAAAVGLGETKVIADAVTSAVNAYGASNLSASAAVDVLIATVRAGKTSAESLAPVLGRVIPISAAMGVEFWEVGAALASMTRTGASAAEATTGLRAFLVGLLKPASQTKDALKSMGLTESQLVEITGGMNLALAQSGLSVESLRRVVTERGLFEGMMLLKTAIGDNKDALGRIIPNVRALTAFLSITGENAELNRVIFEELSKATGSLSKAFEVVSAEPAFRIKASMASVQSALINLGNVMLPIAADLIETFAGFASAIGNVNPAILKVGVGALALLAIIGPVFKIIGSGSLAIGALTRAFEKMQGLKVAAWIANVGTTAKGASVSVGLLRMGLAGIVAGGILAGLYLISKAEERVRQQAQEWAAAITEGLPDAESKIDALKAAMDKIGSAPRIGVSVGIMGGSMGGLTTQAYERLKAAGAEYQTAEKQWAQEQVANNQKRVDAILRVTDAVGASTTAEILAAGASTEAMEKVATAAEQFKEAMGKSFAAATSAVAEFGSATTVTAAQLAKFMKDALTNAKVWSAGLIELQAGGLAPALLQELAEAGPKALPLLKAYLAILHKGGLDAINQTSADTEAVLAKAKEALASGTMFAGEIGADVGQQFVDGVVKGMSDKMRALKDAAFNIGTTVRDRARAGGMIESPSKLMAKDVGAPLVEGVAMGMRGALPSVVAEAERIVRAAASARGLAGRQWNQQAGSAPSAGPRGMVIEHLHVTSARPESIATDIADEIAWRLRVMGS